MFREYSVIKAIGLENLKNDINGTCYGVMHNEWGNELIVNFGNMLLYQTLKMIIINRPQILFEKDLY